MTPGHCCFFAISVGILRTSIDYGYYILCTARIALGSLGFQGPPYLACNLDFTAPYAVLCTVHRFRNSLELWVLPRQRGMT
jgi:hypothetical protein